jgi:hypothetical protein
MTEVVLDSETVTFITACDGANENEENGESHRRYQSFDIHRLLNILEDHDSDFLTVEVFDAGSGGCFHFQTQRRFRAVEEFQCSSKRTSPSNIH